MERVHPQEFVIGQWYLCPHNGEQCHCNLWIKGDYYYRFVTLSSSCLSFIELEAGCCIYSLSAEFQEFMTLFGSEAVA